MKDGKIKRKIWSLYENLRKGHRFIYSIKVET